MAFNFGAFVGGFSKQLVSDLETEEERKFEMEKIAQTEAMRQRAAAASKRRSEQLATEKIMGALSMFYSPENAARIALGGETVAEQYISWGAKFAENGQDANTLLNFGTTSGNMSAPQTKNEVANLVPASAPEATVSTPTGEAIPTETIDLGTNKCGPNLSALNSVYAKPEPTASSFGELIANNIARQVSIATEDPNDPELEVLRRQEEEILAASERYSASQRDSNGETRFFDGTQLENVTNSLLRQAYTRNGFRTNLEGQITDSLEGNEHRQYLAELQAAQALQEDYNNRLNDPMITDKITRMYREATNGFINYGNDIRYSESSSRRKDQVDPVTFNANVTEGRYRVGDVVPVQTADGLVRFVIYTGFPMPSNVDTNNRAMPFLFLN